MRHPDTPAAGHHWDGTHVRTHQARALSVSASSPSRLLRLGQNSHCTRCGNPLEWYTRTSQHPVSLHPGELSAAAVPAECRWHVSSGIAHPAHDGTPWCRITHTLLCPDKPTPDGLSPHLRELRRRMALRTRRLIDTGTFTPACPPHAPAVCRPSHPVVQFLYGRYLATHPVEAIRCVAQTRRRHRCTNPVLDPAHPGTWTLQPTGPLTGQRALPDLRIAVYDLGALPYSEQVRWRTQRCPVHAAAPAAADLARTDWTPFDPLVHHEYLATRLPDAGPAHEHAPRAAGPPTS